MSTLIILYKRAKVLFQNLSSIHNVSSFCIPHAHSLVCASLQATNYHFQFKAQTNETVEFILFVLTVVYQGQIF